jgi:hypothetical protein
MATEQFVSEAIEPRAGSFDTIAMARGEAGVPGEFIWRGTAYTVEELLASWKGTKTDRGEVYLKRHWFRVRVSGGQRMVIYCERQATPGRSPKRRWWLYTIEG